MRLELKGFVVVSYRNANHGLETLTFAADEFSGIDTNNGFSGSSGEPVYQSVWAAGEENVLLRLVITATYHGVHENAWETVSNRPVVINPQVSEDHITSVFEESGKD